MKNIFLLVCFWVSLPVVGATVPKHRVAEDLLRAKLSETFPDASKIEIQNFFIRGNLPENARIIGLHPEIPMGRVQVEYVWEERNSIKQIMGTAVVKVFAKTVVAKSDLETNEPFTEANTRLEERELSQLRVSGYFSSLKDLEEYRARGFVGHGTVIGQLQIAKPVLVQAGQMIDLVLTKRNLRITAKVKALERGTFNQWIRVENPNSKRILQGRVVDFGQVSTN